MPTYEYHCEHCGHRLEAFQRMSDDPLTECPECGHATLRRLISGGFISTGGSRGGTGRGAASASKADQILKRASKDAKSKTCARQASQKPTKR